MDLSLIEVGKRLSSASKEKIKAAMEALKALMDAAEGDATAATEAARTLLEAAGLSFSERERLIRDAIRARFGGSGDNAPWVWCHDVYDDYAIYTVEPRDGSGDLESKTYRVGYSLLDGVVNLGEPTEVRKVVTYEPVTQQESAHLEVELTGDLVPLVEAKAVGKDGLTKVKIISPGVGTSGYYGADLLSREAAKFAGAQCYWDHPTVTEEADRPERSLRDLAGKVVGTPTWNGNGPKGPGVYADVQVFKPYQEAVQELAPHIGLSMRGLGKAKMGEIDGRKMPVIESIEKVKSVDFVTMAGRGGEVLQLFEAARGGRANITKEVHTVDEKEAQALREAAAAKDAEITRLQEATATLEATNKRLQEALLLREARDVVVAELAKVEMPELTRQRLTETLAARPVLKDGALDKEAYCRTIDEAAKAELQYIASVTGAGQVRGLGSAGGQGGAADAGAAALQESFKALYRAQGMSEEVAARMAASAAGR